MEFVMKGSILFPLQITYEICVTSSFVGIVLSRENIVIIVGCYGTDIAMVL